MMPRSKKKKKLKIKKIKGKADKYLDAWSKSY